MSKPQFKPVFVRWWIGLTLLASLPISVMGLSFTIYRSPESLSDYLLWAWYLVKYSLIVSPISALLAFGVAKLVATRSPTSSPPAPPTCNVCQYNLTGNLSGVCPECGTRITSPVTTRLTHGRLVVYMIIGTALAFWLFEFAMLSRSVGPAMSSP